MEDNGAGTSGREFTANLFIRRMQKSVSRRIAIQIILGMVLFVSGFYFMIYSTNESNADENLAMLEDVYRKLYTQSVDFLNEERTVAAFQERIKDPSSPVFEYRFNRFQTKSLVRNEVILADEDGMLIDSSFPEGELSNYLVDYNRAICYNVKNTGTRDIYVATFFDTGTYSDYMFVKPVFEEEERKGYITLFIMGTDWNFYLSDESHDGVIVDQRQNVIYRSKAGFANQSGIFSPQSGRVWTYNGRRYWVKSESLPEYGVTIYSLVYYPKNNTFLIGVLVIIIMGALWFHLADWMSRTMAGYNAKQISRLVGEIRQIQKGDHLHRIHMGTNDEFDEVAHRINRMLDSVRELNSKNTELIMLNARLEMGQLEAQMNPHFLYNTLEIIRNLVLLNDGEKAEALIEKLVHILRYSVNSSYRDVHLQEDMKYIEDYLSIQNMRFGDRFCCEIRFDDACGGCMIPKLLLQPIIENTIKYGFKTKMVIHMWIHGYMEEGVLVISVRDDGPGMPQEKADELSQILQQTAHRTDSLGLYNIARRLSLQYGEKSGMQIVNRPGEGFEILLRIEQRGQS